MSMNWNRSKIEAETNRVTSTVERRVMMTDEELYVFEAQALAVLPDFELVAELRRRWSPEFARDLMYSIADLMASTIRPGVRLA